MVWDRPGPKQNGAWLRSSKDEKTNCIWFGPGPDGTFIGRAQADEVADLKKEVERQYDVLLKMQAKLLEIEAGQKKNAEAISEAATAAPVPGSLAAKLQ